MRKLIYGALAMAAALSITVGVNTQNAAATPKPTEKPVATLGYDIDWANQSMTVTGNTQVSVAFPTVKADKTTPTKLTVTVKSWDVYQGEEATVDLSKLNPSKVSYVAIKDESGAKQLLVFNAETRKLKAVYTPAYTDSEKPTIDVQKDGATVTDTNFEYRTAYSEWNQLIETSTEDSATTSKLVADLSPYIQEGAQLNIRAAAVPADSTDSTFTATGYTVKEVGTLASKEIKVKVAALPNAPKVTTDYKNNQFKLAKGTQYRLDYTSDWKTAPDTGVLKLSDIATKNEQNEITGYPVVLQSRTAADSAKKKAASKITSVNITAPAAAPTLIDVTGGSTLLADIREDASKGAVSILKTSSDDESSSPAPTGNVTVQLDAKKGTIIKNTFSTDSGVNIDVIAGDKVTTVKPGKDTKIKYAAGTKLSIRYSAVTKDIVDKTTKDVITQAAWASETVELGTMVEFYTAPTAAPETSAAAG
jgi:hypothetical protein